MGYKFSDASRKHLSECHPDLQDVALAAIEVMDCMVLEGHRSREEQDNLFRKNLSKVQWPNSRHNSKPSEAYDIAPYPIDWKDTKRFYYFAGIMMGIAHMKNIKLRWGGDWDSDNDLNDQSFMDLVHFERVVEDDSNS